MKHYLMLTFLVLGISIRGAAQKIFAVKYASQADSKVFVVKYESQADLLVYKVSYPSETGNNQGKWYFVEYASQPNKKFIGLIMNVWHN